MWDSNPSLLNEKLRIINLLLIVGLCAKAFMNRLCLGLSLLVLMWVFSGSPNVKEWVNEFLGFFL